MSAGLWVGLTLAALGILYAPLSLAATILVARRGDDRLTQGLTAALWGGYTLSFWLVVP